MIQSPLLSRLPLAFFLEDGVTRGESIGVTALGRAALGGCWESGSAGADWAAAEEGSCKLGRLPELLKDARRPVGSSFAACSGEVVRVRKRLIPRLTL